jgi:hypothetical protein
MWMKRTTINPVKLKLRTTPAATHTYFSPYLIYFLHQKGHIIEEDCLTFAGPKTSVACEDLFSRGEGSPDLS